MTWEDWLEQGGFKLVYQGGHHNVYCNGAHHLKTGGGHAGHWTVAPHPRWPMYKCDCAKWKDLKRMGIM